MSLLTVCIIVGALGIGAILWEPILTLAADWPRGRAR